jgi:hypothetical protein
LSPTALEKVLDYVEVGGGNRCVKYEGIVVGATENGVDSRPGYQSVASRPSHQDIGLSTAGESVRAVLAKQGVHPAITPEGVISFRDSGTWLPRVDCELAE